MNRASWCWLVIALSAAGSVSSAEDAPAGDAKELEGTWRFQAAESEEEGWDQPLEMVRTWVWWVRDADLSGQGPAPGRTEASFRLDPRASPKKIDLIYPDGNEDDTTLQGIYKLEKGRLIVCLRSAAEAARGRPEKFVFSGGEGLSLLILTKAGGR